MTFHVGQKVVCIEGEFDQAALAISLGVALPTKGVIYTIRNFEDRGDEPCLRLIEIVNPKIMHHGDIFDEPAYANDCFRPLVEKKTDISIFTAMLNQKQREHEFTI